MTLQKFVKVTDFSSYNKVRVYIPIGLDSDKLITRRLSELSTGASYWSRKVKNVQEIKWAGGTECAIFLADY